MKPLPILPIPPIRPVFLTLGLLVSGILLAPYCTLSAPIAYSLAAVALLPGGWLLTRRQVTPLCLLALCLPWFFLGMGRAQEVRSPARNDLMRWQGQPSLWIYGVIVSEIEEKPYRSIGFTLEARRVFDFSQRFPATGRARVIVRGITRANWPEQGETVWLRGRVFAPAGATNPGGFDYRAYLERRGILSQIVVKQGADLKADLEQGNRGARGSVGPLRLAGAVRAAVQEATARSLSPEDAALVDGLLLSARQNLPADLEEAFARTGAVHVLSVSGLHLAALAGFLTVSLRLLSTPRPWANLLTIVLLWLFALASGASAAAVRAAIMASVVLLAPLLRRRAEPLHSLSVAGIGIVLAEPGVVYDAGFQLSFVTTAALLVWMPPLLRLWLPWEPGMPRGQQAARMVCAAFLVGIVAEAGSAPLVAFHFNRITLVGPIANLILAPLTELTLLGGLLASGVSWLPPLLLAPVWGLVGLGATVVREAAFVFAAVPWASCSIVSPTPLLLALYYVFLGGSALALRQMALRKTLFAPPPPEAVFYTSSAAGSADSADSADSDRMRSTTA